MIFPLARRSVVATASGQAGRVEAPHGICIASLKCQVHMGCRLAIAAERIDPQLVAQEVRFVVGADWLVERAEHRAIEPFRGSEVARSQVDVIDQSADVPLAHGVLRNCKRRRTGAGVVSESG